jgi:hypothetical protein
MAMAGLNGNESRGLVAPARSAPEIAAPTTNSDNYPM